MVVSVPCDIGKDLDTSFERHLQIFVGSVIVREPLSCSYCPIISSVRPSGFFF